MVDPIDASSLLGRGADATLEPVIYRQLRALARRALAGEDALLTLDTTALVHEAWLNLADHAGVFVDRAHFFAFAATSMRSILVDHARRRLAQKRGGGRKPEDVDISEIPGEQAASELLALDSALSRLDAVEPRLARVVELRFFAGLTVEETAEALGVVGRSVVRDWARARVFLKEAMG